MVDHQHGGAEVIPVVTSAKVTCADLAIMKTYTAGIKDASIGFISCKDAAGTTRKIMCQDV